MRLCTRLLSAGLALAATPSAFAAPTPPGAFSGCGAGTLDAAVKCLRDGLSEDDREALVAGANTSSTRGRLDALVRREILSEGTNSLLARRLAELGINHPMLQSAAVIESYLASERGRTLDLRAIARLNATMPPAMPLDKIERMLGLPTPPTPQAPPARISDAD
jgi:hypothetical protein